MAKILIVDDEEHIRYLYSEELSEAGYEVITADSGYKLMERIEKEKPDLIVLDIMMPRKDGYILCAELKADEKTSNIPIVLLTAVGEAVPTTTYTHADGMSTEADEYIAKPIDTESLWKVVSDLLG